MKLIELLIEDETHGIQAVSLVSEPAIEENWVALSEVKLKAVDEEKRLVMGAALVPNKPILRVRDGEEFYIFFSADTIRKAAEGYMKAKRLEATNIEHELAVSEVTTVESWIVEDSQIDKSALHGMKYDAGTWVVTMKVDNLAVWEDFIKTGRLQGFSIEGKFSERLESKEELIEQKPSESEDDFLSRCMSELSTEYPEEGQRYAVCRTYIEMERTLSEIVQENR